jgi:hypothetical protein
MTTGRPGRTTSRPGRPLLPPPSRPLSTRRRRRVRGRPRRLRCARGARPPLRLRGAALARVRPAAGRTERQGEDPNPARLRRKAGSRAARNY